MNDKNKEKLSDINNYKMIKDTSTYFKKYYFWVPRNRNYDTTKQRPKADI